MIQRIAHGISALLILIGGLAVFAMMGVSMSDAVMREAGRPILGASEMSEALMVIAVSCALPVSVLSGKAISVDFFIKRLPRNLREAIVLAGVVASFLIAIYFAYRAVIAGFQAASFGEAYHLLRVPYGPFYMCLAAGVGLSGLAFLIGAGRDSWSMQGEDRAEAPASDKDAGHGS